MRGEELQLSLAQAGDVSIVRVTDARLTYPMLASFFSQVQQIVEGGARKLVVDLEAVTYIDSASIGCLVDIHRLLAQRDGTLRLSGLQPRVETLLSMTGVKKVVNLHQKEAEALAAFGRPPRQNGEAAHA